MLPHFATPDDYDKQFRRKALFEKAIATLAARHGLPGDAPEHVRAGSNVIFAVGPRHIVKLFAPLFRADFERERAALSAMGAAIAVPVPELVAEGELDGWNYVILTRLEGELPRSVWADVPVKDRLAIARQMGEVTAAIHAAPVPESLVVDWPAFLAKQAAECAERHRQWGAPDKWVAQIGPYVERYGPDPAVSPLVLQHADLHDRNVLIKRVRGRWRLAGVLDFGDALVGDREYDFVQMVLWLFYAEAGMLGAFLKSYGLPKPDEAFARRMMAWSLLHRFGTLKLMRRLARPRRPRDLETLAEVLFLDRPR